MLEGDAVGSSVREAEGMIVSALGCSDGKTVEIEIGTNDEITLGTTKGEQVGDSVGDIVGVVKGGLVVE